MDGHLTGTPDPQDPSCDPIDERTAPRAGSTAASELKSIELKPTRRQPEETAARLRALGLELKEHGAAIAGGGYGIAVTVAAFFVWAALFGRAGDAILAIAVFALAVFVGRAGRQLRNLGEQALADEPASPKPEISPLDQARAMARRALDNAPARDTARHLARDVGRRIRQATQRRIAS